MPGTLHNTARVTFIGLCWDGITSAIPTLTEEEELSFLSVLSSKLNHKVRLQLSTDSIVDRLLHTSKISSGLSAIIVLGGSHTSRLADKLGSAHPEVVDLKIVG